MTTNEECELSCIIDYIPLHFSQSWVTIGFAIIDISSDPNPNPDVFIYFYFFHKQEINVFIFVENDFNMMVGFHVKLFILDL